MAGEPRDGRRQISGSPRPGDHRGGVLARGQARPCERSATTEGQLAASAGSMGTLAPGGAGDTRRAQRIRWPVRSRSGSIPKLFCSEVAHRSGRGFPNRFWPSRAKTVVVCLALSRAARGARNSECYGGSGQGCDRLSAARNVGRRVGGLDRAVSCACPSSQIGFLDG